LETLCLHAGQSPDLTTNERAVPIARTSSYVFNNIIADIDQALEKTASS
jgi:O-acetylhomoserine/O-acetylserine sulfhydrylase-like pyridoxal-dependent enzyme